jgi:acetylornithine deacetylase/succinyl-diaminopimelate desuccinylase-like protein
MIIDRGEIFPALEVDPAHPGTILLAAMHEQVTEQKAIVDVSPTVTDGGWFGDAGIPAVIYGPGELCHAHSVNEQVSIHQLVIFTKVLLAFVLRWTSSRKQ